MNEPVIWGEVLGLSVSGYAALLAVFALLCALIMHKAAVRRGLKKYTTLVYMFCAVPLALFLARGVYCAVRYVDIFLDEMGEFDGFWHFFDLTKGGMNIAGALAGCLAAGWACARITGQKAGAVLDSAAPAGALLIALARFIEPLSGQGYGDYIEAPIFGFYPFVIQNEWGEAVLAVCAIEGLLALVLFGVLAYLGKRTRRPGTLALYFLALFCTSQIIPQSLRYDDVLMIFVFARVTQIGYVLLFCGAVAYAGLLAARRTGITGPLIVQWLAVLAGVGLCIAAEFALDKTNLPDGLVYAVMAAALAGMAALAVWRIKKEDAV